MTINEVNSSFVKNQQQVYFKQDGPIIGAQNGTIERTKRSHKASTAVSSPRGHQKVSPLPSARTYMAAVTQMTQAKQDTSHVYWPKTKNKVVGAHNRVKSKGPDSLKTNELSTPQRTRHSTSVIGHLSMSVDKRQSMPKQIEMKHLKSASMNDHQMYSSFQPSQTLQQQHNQTFQQQNQTFQQHNQSFQQLVKQSFQQQSQVEVVQHKFGTINELTLEEADSIANSAINCGKRNGFNPFSVTVLDDTGYTIVHKRMTGCQKIGIPEFATAKAYSCVVTKLSSRQFRDKYTSAKDPAKFCQMTSMVAVSGDKMMPCPGGVLIKNKNGRVLGAVGVSGAAADEDEYCAMMGVLETNPHHQILPENDSCATKKDKISIQNGALKQLPEDNNVEKE